MTDHNDTERAAAEALRLALEGEAAEGEAAEEAADLASLAERVRAAAGQARPLDDRARDQAVEAALSRMAPAEPAAPAERPSRRARPAPRRPSWAVVALAAGLAAILVGSLLIIDRLAQDERPEPIPIALPDEAYTGPTDPLFDGPFPEGQSPADRADRIVAARTRGYFAALAARLEAEGADPVPPREARAASPDEPLDRGARVALWPGDREP